MQLSYYQRLWLLTADPESWALFEMVPTWLIAECTVLGLISGPGAAGTYSLTAAGQAEWHALTGR